MSKRRRMKGSGSLRQRGNIWWITYYVNGRPIAESAHTTDKEQAGNLLKQRIGDIASGKEAPTPEKATIADLCDLVLADYRIRRLRDLTTTKWRYEANVKPLLGSLTASQFSPRHVREYITVRRSAGASDATINRELAIVRRGFSLGRDEKPPLVRSVPRIQKLEEDNARQGFIEQRQYMTLCSVLPEHLKALFVVGYHCGNRLGELRKLRWDQVDMNAGEIRIERKQAKGKRPRTLPIYGEMLEWLKWQAKRGVLGCDLVFHYEGHPIGSHMKGWARGCKEAGLQGLHFHDLRRSAIRNMERAGIPRNVAKAVSGHKTDSVYQRYDIVAESDLKAAGKKLAEYLRQQKPKLRRVK